MGVGNNKADDYGFSAVVCVFRGTQGKRKSKWLSVYSVDFVRDDTVVLYAGHDRTGNQIDYKV